MKRSTHEGRRHRRALQAGFTLVELLVVIFIIAILAGLITVGVTQAKKVAKNAQANTEINSFGVGLESYFMDYNIYPAYGTDDVDMDRNDFPKLYEALLGEKAPNGGGGKNAPYVEKLKRENTVVESFAGDEAQPYEQAMSEDLYSSDVEKYYLDPFGTPYFYRENKSKRNKEYWMINRDKYDFWSCGPNEKNQSIEGIPERQEDKKGYDDVGNW
jgi:prepilin-type N-terminal cleavage/methylation domain-containing protein